MPATASRHLLPLNSLLFDSHVRLPHASQPTLVNILEAADTSMTALPMPLPARATKPSLWRRVLGTVKKAFRKKAFRKKDYKGKARAQGGLEIGAPTGFVHVETRGAAPLRGDSEEWEDVESMRGFGRR